MRNEMIEVGSLIESSRVQETYVDSYKRRYGVAPIISTNGTDQTVFKDLARSLGIAKACQLVEHYFKMNNDWFVKKGHSVAVLKSEIGVINGALGDKPQQQASLGGLRMRVFLYCDARGCDVKFTRDVAMNHNFEQSNRCTKCAKPDSSIYLG